MLLAASACAYLWSLSASGHANSFYSAAAQAGSQSWKAWFFGSLDAGNAITVDKPPAALWLMGLSVRLFGLSSWSILVPQALLGVGSVHLVFVTVRRVNGHVAGLLAGAATALTPAAALMFRFNNPDALLVLLLTAAGYVVLRATEKASGRLVALAGILMHRAFMLGDPPDDATIERVVDHVILPAVRHPSCGKQAGTQARTTQQGNPKFTKTKARKTT